MPAQIANDVTGEAVLTDPEGREYRIIFDLSAVMDVERMSGHSAVDIMAGRPSVTDCVCMIIAGAAGYQRRNPAGAKKVNPNLAQRILIDCGGLVRVAPVLAESMSCAEGLGLGPDPDEDDGGGEPPGPLVPPGS